MCYFMDLNLIQVELALEYITSRTSQPIALFFSIIQAKEKCVNTSENRYSLETRGMNNTIRQNINNIYNLELNISMYSVAAQHLSSSQLSGICSWHYFSHIRYVIKNILNSNILEKIVK